ncbi:MAG: glycoside hydrolase family 2 TIM barrel-domain containing protein [Fimbriimonadaceae bacterium]
MLAVFVVGLLLTATAPRVEIVSVPAGFELRRNGVPYFVKGAGANRMLAEVAAAGGNSIRTWGAVDIGRLLDRAHAKGLTVTVGFWLEKRGPDVSYRDQAVLDAQLAEVERGVRAYRNHPAVLMWAIGNEMELGIGDEAEPMWRQVDRLARRVKQLDPRRPVITVVADMWPEKMDQILAFCPSVDALGVNSYGGLPTLHERMARWRKPYFVTEFQCVSPHDVPRLGGEQPIEPSSTQKAEQLESVYRGAILAHPGRVLGGYVFHWERSDNQTASWFSMHLSTGERLASVETIQRLWGGPAPANRVPVVVRATRLNPAGWRLEVRDPDGDPVAITWELAEDDPNRRFVGDFEKRMPLVKRRTTTGPEFAMPVGLVPGPYRLYAIARDGRGGAASWNVPFVVGTDGTFVFPPKAAHEP